MNSTFHSHDDNARNDHAFTLFELLVIITVIALLAAMVLPVLVRNRSDSKAFRCLNNQRQLTLAFRAYAEDNNDYLPGNDFPWMTFVSSIPFSARGNWAPGSMATADKANVFALRDSSISQLYNYLKTSDAFKCPADQSAVVRSVSMSAAVGVQWCYAGNGYNPPTGVLRGSQPLSGAWLPGSYNASQTTWLTYGKFSSMIRPTPANLWVIMDEHPDSINDSQVVTAAVPGYLIDYPASYHAGAGGISFGDGHAEMHYWQDSRTKPPITGSSLLSVVSINNPDTAWLAQRTSALR